MPESESRGAPAVYRLRAVVAGVSPLIWRRLLIRDDITVAGLHEVLQAGFGWSGEHLHAFTVHAVDYGADNGRGRRPRLADLRLRERERFGYAYNFFADWRLDLRVEAIGPAVPGAAYPRCVGGRRAGPPEEWDGPFDYLQRTEPHRIFRATVRAAQILQVLLDADPDTTVAEALGEEDYDELARLRPLLGVDRFDRRALNRALAGLATTERASA